MKWMFLALVLIGTASWAAIHFSLVKIPPNWAPWGAVELDEEPAWFARMQINSLTSDPAACYGALDNSSIEYRRLDDRPIVDGCGLEAGAEILRSQIAYSSGFRTTCGITAALYWYERRLDALAVEHLGSKITRIRHLGTYSCRNIGGGQRRSQHATANAIDLAGFTLADGTTVSVLRDWGDGGDKGRFLLAARDEACRFFNTVLGPEYNQAHADHFHLDLGRARICR
ncbi:extensin family protein [Iodidimonas sp. SYSU 1G8]|uniref:extensin-like domain-containing protein n=1 Tax=Iodidimonas sp. SYSU 1G8 TaxID=3133967 RepID=UPI0031FEAFB0